MPPPTRGITSLAALLGVCLTWRETASFELSCAQAHVPDHPLDFCDMISWRAAVLYQHVNSTDYGGMLSREDQDHVARRQYSDLLLGREVTEECHHALQRFICASVFPECPHEGVDRPYIPVCRVMCRDAESACGAHLSCEYYESTDCTASLNDGFFVLKHDQGPYEPLPYLYGLLLFIWTTLACVWLYEAFVRHRYGASRLCRLVACVPLAKVAMMMLSLGFWSTCVKWGFCSFWMGVSLINCQLMYETFSLIGFVLIAKGWCVTRPSFHHNEWRTVVVLMCSFYLASSSLLLVRRLVISSIVFWLSTSILYGAAYSYVLMNVQERLTNIRRFIRSASHDLMRQRNQPPQLIEVLISKYYMYQSLSILLGLFCITELFFCLLPIVHHMDVSSLSKPFQGLVAAVAELDGRLWLTLVIHEFIEIAILTLVGYIFRPQLMTSLYYIEFSPAELEARRRPPPTYLVPVPSSQYDEQYSSASSSSSSSGKDCGLGPHKVSVWSPARISRTWSQSHWRGLWGFAPSGSGLLVDEEEEMDDDGDELAGLCTPLKKAKPTPDSKYHSSKFLVVSQPGQGSYAVAVVDPWYTR